MNHANPLSDRPRFLVRCRVAPWRASSACCSREAQAFSRHSSLPLLSVLGQKNGREPTVSACAQGGSARTVWQQGGRAAMVQWEVNTIVTAQRPLRQSNNVGSCLSASPCLCERSMQFASRLPASTCTPPRAHHECQRARNSLSRFIIIWCSRHLRPPIPASRFLIHTCKGFLLKK